MGYSTWYEEAEQDEQEPGWLRRNYGFIAIPVAVLVIALGMTALKRAEDTSNRERVEFNIAECKELGGEVVQFSNLSKCIVDGNEIVRWDDEGYVE